MASRSNLSQVALVRGRWTPRLAARRRQCGFGPAETDYASAASDFALAFPHACSIVTPLRSSSLEEAVRTAKVFGIVRSGRIGLQLNRQLNNPFTERVFTSNHADHDFLQRSGDDFSAEVVSINNTTKGVVRRVIPPEVG